MLRVDGLDVYTLKIPHTIGAGQDFTEIDAYGVEGWLGELALARRQDHSIVPTSSSYEGFKVARLS